MIPTLTARVQAFKIYTNAKRVRLFAKISLRTAAAELLRGRSWANSRPERRRDQPRSQSCYEKRTRRPAWFAGPSSGVDRDAATNSASGRYALGSATRIPANGPSSFSGRQVQTRVRGSS